MSDQTASTESYRVYTRLFDKEVVARQWPLRPSLERAWEALMEQTARERTAWELKALEHAAHIFATTGSAVLRDTVVTLLVDHSGSMRGGRMLLTATAVDVARIFLEHLGVAVEVLGFTTRSWKGGWSRRLWRWRGRKPKPGRLCDLLHIVYKSGKEGTDVRCFAHMLDSNLLKENVDGEAILWAAARQNECGKSRKAIVLISDGAPVDDSTLLANGLDILRDHLNDVIDDLKATTILAQLQIGEKLRELFPYEARADTLPELGDQLLELLVRVIIETCEDRAAE